MNEVSKKLSESRAKSEEELSYVKKELKKLFDMIKQPPSKKEIETSDNRYDHIFLKDVQIYIGSAKVKASHGRKKYIQLMDLFWANTRHMHENLRNYLLISLTS
jgi:hypothetical protein